MQTKYVNVIGAGLAGCECAWILSQNGIKVKLYEMKPSKKSEAHKSNNFAELVCSNSLKSEEITNACGLLKKEMQTLGSLFVEAAYETRVEAGQALAVDREKFSDYITEKIKNEKNIEIIYEEVENVEKLEGIVVIASGPLTSKPLLDDISKLIGEEKLYFYDAEAPIVSADSIDMNIAYRMNRYGEIGVGDYLNLPMTKQEYLDFYNALVTAEEAPRHDFDKLILFEGCMPIEEMAKRGEKTLVFGPLKPVGLENPKTEEKPYAVVQLRSENSDNTMYNLVGFQTSLKYGEQKRVFGMIPGLKEAVFERYGVMHKNSYINSSKILDNNFCMKDKNNIYFAGQISGVEGYVESAASGLMVAYNIINRMKNCEVSFPDTTMLGSLAKYISTENKHFQPMNANFGILKPLEVRIKNKKEKYQKMADIALNDIINFKNSLK